MSLVCISIGKKKGRAILLSFVFMIPVSTKCPLMSFPPIEISPWIFQPTVPPVITRYHTLSHIILDNIITKKIPETKISKEIQNFSYIWIFCLFLFNNWLPTPIRLRNYTFMYIVNEQQSSYRVTYIYIYFFFYLTLFKFDQLIMLPWSLISYRKNPRNLARVTKYAQYGIH
jgi:hypothetical protein